MPCSRHYFKGLITEEKWHSMHKIRNPVTKFGPWRRSVIEASEYLDDWARGETQNGLESSFAMALIIISRVYRQKSLSWRTMGLSGVLTPSNRRMLMTKMEIRVIRCRMVPRLTMQIPKTPNAFLSKSTVKQYTCLSNNNLVRRKGNINWWASINITSYPVAKRHHVISGSLALFLWCCEVSESSKAAA